MTWISARSALKTVVSMVSKLEDGKSLTIESFKRDRWVKLSKKGQRVIIEERGFNDNKIEVMVDDLSHVLKEIFEREFPRSHQLRMSVSKES
ncbi:hypothetical protein [Metallosphaera hakonensis]|uniref:Uncharacterized protein n=1 Tax=Metallosphaera hakonensis JCM 8857 = DSM 7519 TaxID=1293036 RepID=A0A2U9IRM8_9CREN|nr:hypothetical protein [Metallosphaera hakonensis]AWR98682.1 hypothetical protein DFR87_02020 [Metallosphaera hakonensis JCM 8857 = DSM 7519]